MGVSDMITSFLYAYAARVFHNKTLISICQILLAISSSLLSLSLYLTDPSKTQPQSIQVLYSVTIFGMRFFSALSFMCAYQANNDYFPTLLKGAIFALTNVVARLASVFSPIVAEGMGNPSVTVAIGSFITFLASIRLNNTNK